MRQPLVIANWKMNGDIAANRDLVQRLLPQLKANSARCVICPPFTYIGQLGALLEGSAVTLGAQDCSHCESGAYTGEVSPLMLADCGCRWVLLGHSERRQYHGESDVLVGAKLVAAQRAGLMPVLCVGETREQREAGQAESVVRDQLRATLADLSSLDALIVAYEPVWAIGTGLTATPEQAQEMHAHIRAVLRDLDEGAAAAMPLLYGGSVKADNAADLFAQPDIDGALVGGASLEADAFAAIVNAAR